MNMTNQDREDTRDVFAAIAMHAHISRHASFSQIEVAQIAYAVADAMLTQRDKDEESTQ